MKNILMIIPYYEIYPPMNGGMLRCFHILRQLAKHYKVTAVIHQDAAEFRKAAEEFPELEACEIISTSNYPVRKDIFSLLPGKVSNGFRFRYWKRTLKGPADGNFLQYYPVLTDILSRKQYDYVILENLTTLNAAPVVRRLSPGSFIVYDAHNVDSYLAGSKESSMHDPGAYKTIFSAESALHKLVDGVITCSDDDLQQFRKMNSGPLKGAVIPNGIEIRRDLPTSNDDTGERIIFCGSLDYAPNEEGLLWFCERILPALTAAIPTLRLLVVGKGQAGRALQQALTHPAVINYGRVDSVDPYYQKAAVAVVPLHTGSGTRLKVLEAMSRKVPIVATAKGAEGIAYTPGKNICIADSETDFQQAIMQLLGNKTAAASMAAEGYQLVREHYDWQVIGTKLSEVLDNRFN